MLGSAVKRLQNVLNQINMVYFHINSELFFDSVPNLCVIQAAFSQHDVHFTTRTPLPRLF